MLYPWLYHRQMIRQFSNIDINEFIVNFSIFRFRFLVWQHEAIAGYCKAAKSYCPPGNIFFSFYG
jgi:hypothetical protein